MTPRLKEKYDTSIRADLKEKLAYSNIMDVPCLDKIVVNMGVGDAISDARMMEMAVAELTTITGQKPSVRLARLSISNFKLRKGQQIGCMSTLRGRRMYEFMDRLFNIAMPRIRDFRGMSRSSFDGQGNYTAGIKDQTIFPEVDLDSVQRVRGMNITFVMKKTVPKEHSLELLTQFGLPFRNVNEN